jgi:DNA-binding CsgD family transcriptional regulator/uncharacterized protein (DUF433 family)
MVLTLAHHGARLGSCGRRVWCNTSLQPLHRLNWQTSGLGQRHYADGKPDQPHAQNYWTRSDIDRAFQLRAEGHTCAYTGQLLGRSQSSVESRLAARRVIEGPHRPTPWSPEDLQMLSVLRAQGRSQSQIARALGRSRSSVYTRLKLQDNPSDNLSMSKPWSEADYKYLCELRAAGKSWNDINAEFPGRTKQAVMDKLRYARRKGKDINNRKPWTKDDDDLLEHYREELQLSNAEIGRRLGRSVGSIDMRLHRKQLVVPCRKWTPEEDEVLLSSRVNGLSFGKIASLLPARRLTALKWRSAVLKDSQKAAHRQYSTACRKSLSSAGLSCIAATARQTTTADTSRLKNGHILFARLLGRPNGSPVAFLRRCAAVVIRGDGSRTFSIALGREHQSTSKGVKSNRDWTAEEMERVKLLHDKSQPTKSIAESVERSAEPTTHGKQRWWSSSDKERLAEMLKTTKSADVVMAAFPGRTLFAVKAAIARVRRHALNKGGRSVPRVWRSEDDAKLRQLHSEGMSLAHIAVQLGRSRGSVQVRAYRKLRLRGPVSKPSWTVREDETLLALRKKGVSYKEIVLQLPGRSEDAASSRHYALMRT